MGIIASVILLLLGNAFPFIEEYADRMISKVNFSDLVLDFMLSFLLFAGALHTDLDKLKKSKGAILGFATIGVLISTFLVGTSFYYIIQWFGMSLDYIRCLLFGAVIAPTDPIAVLGILKRANVSKSIEVKITGESLFNDGVAVVVFLTILEIVQTGVGEISVSHIGILFLEEVAGGVGLGLIAGYLSLQLMKTINHYQTEVIITLAVVMGGYALASAFHFSGPLTMVIAGLMIGNPGSSNVMSKTTIQYVDQFWEMVDEILNAFLFLLIGLEMILIIFHREYVYIGILAFIVVVLVRYIALFIPSTLFNIRKTFADHALKVMTWGGLKGGISIALALSLGRDERSDILVAATYVVVLISILLQGLTIEKLIKKTGLHEVKK